MRPLFDINSFKCLIEEFKPFLIYIRYYNHIGQIRHNFVVSIIHFATDVLHRLLKTSQTKHCIEFESWDDCNIEH